MRGVNSRNPVPYTVLAFKLHSCVKLSTTCEINGKAVTVPILTHTAVLPCNQAESHSHLSYELWYNWIL